MAEFTVDFSESLNQLAQFQLRIANLGTQLDKIETQSGKTTSASAKLLKETTAEFDKLEKMLASVGVDAEKVGGIMQRVRTDTANMLSGVSASNLKATVAQRAYNGELAELGRLMQDTAGKNNFVRTQQQLASLSERLSNENKVLTATIAAMDTQEGKLNVTLKEQLAAKRNSLKTRQEELTADQLLEKQTISLRAALEQLSNEQTQENLITQQLINSRKAEIVENQKLDSTLQQLERQMRSLNGGTAEQIEKSKAAVAARRDEINAADKEAAVLAKLMREYQSLNGGIAESIVRQQQLNNARKTQIRDGDKVSQVENEATKAIRLEEAALAKLQAQLQLMSGPRGAEVTALRQQIMEQERYNKLAAQSTSQLLGFGKSHEQLRLSQAAGNQAAAALRAGLQGLHASVGMYTSATVVGATATYGLATALRDSVITGAEFNATMSRTNAVMSTNGAQWMGSRADEAKALETQVRALGQTTVFTASEVGQGLQVLGAAGFAASDAITALPATLQLANIANVDMAKSADIATNVLSTFGMQAKDLQGVVDLMATAVNNSNTDIGELANALSYAGPAAHTAGISIQDTTAAIETLANSGIKASRAGNGLRRLFVSLLNPTKKGQEVLDKYGISVLDAAGNTRSLVEIVQQMSAAFKNLPGGERLSAIQNLVGLYATAPVASLVENSDRLAAFRSQNDDVSGAGGRMEKIISDNLKFDWKEMLSALEELQLQAFDALDGRLREFVAGATSEILKLMEPVATVMGGDGKEIKITGLDRLIQDAETAAVSIGYIGAAYVGLRVTTGTGNILKGLADGAKSLGERLTIVSGRMADTASSQAALLRQTAATTGALQAQQVTLVTGATALSGLSAAGSTAAVVLGRVAAAAGLLMRGLGWVGLIYGIGSALYEVFSSSTDEKILDHKNNVDEVKSSYDQLKESIEASGLAKQRQALEMQKGADLKGAGQVQTRIDSISKTITEGQAAGATPESLAPLQGELSTLEGLLKQYKDGADNSQKALDSLGKTTLDYNDQAEKQRQRVEALTSVTNQLTAAQAELNVAMASGQMGNPAAVEQLVKLRDDAIKKANEGAGRVTATLADVPTLDKVFAADDEKRAEDARQEKYKKLVPEAQQLLDVEKKISEERQHQADLIEKDKKAAAGEGPRVGADIAKRSSGNLTDLEAQRLVLQDKVTAQNEKMYKAQEDASRVTRSDAENLVELTKQRSEVEAQIRDAKATGQDKTDPEKVTALYVKQRDVLSQIKGLEKKDTKADDKAQKEAERDLKAAQTQYDGLAKKFDALTYSQRELEKGTHAMNLLRAAGKITIEQENKALGELNLQHYLAVQSLDKNRVALEKLRDGYSESAFGVAANDLAVLNKGLQDGTVKLEEYNRVYGQIRKKQLDQATSGLPDASVSPGDYGGSIFTDFLGKVDEQAQGSKQYDQRQKDLDQSLEIQLAANQREQDVQLEQLAAKKLNQEENAKELLEIEQRFQDQKTAIQTTAGEQQNAVAKKSADFQAQMSALVLAGALGTAANILGQFASADKEASGAQKAAFVLQKGLAVAQIILYTEVAAARAGAELGFAGIPLATIIRATGYANAGIVAALAIGSLASGGESSSGSSGGSTQMYDTGGYIPYNRVGIVGEYGPELVRGPASVTGRTATANKMGSSSGGDIHVTIAPSVSVQTGQGTSADPTADGKAIANTVNAMVEEKTREMIRPGGILYEWERNK